MSCRERVGLADLGRIRLYKREERPKRKKDDTCQRYSEPRCINREEEIRGERERGEEEKGEQR